VPPSLKTFLQYTIILAVTGLLIWVSLGNLTVTEGSNKWDYLAQTWKSANKSMLILMAVLAMISHAIRAERWRLLIVPTGYQTKFSYSFFSLMVGYLVNLVIPRGGELSRCYNLYKLDKTPVETSFGTVVVERVVDVICLVILIGISFIVESKKLFAFIDTLPVMQGGFASKLKILFGITAAFIGFLVALYFFVKKSEKLRGFVIRTWSGFREGLLSVFKLEQKGLFIVYSIAIWLLYFLMSYVVILAFPETNHLGASAVLSLFAIGAIAMTVPLPGGTGSYHVLVPQGLIFLYNIGRPEAVAFTFIFHGWQTAIMIVGGALSLVVTSVLVRRKKTG
jgi:glycosyltransferase 2 family protein